MKSIGAKILAIAAILVFTVPGAAAACAGSESCRMPCCRASAGDPGHHDGGAGRPDCCESEGVGITACRPAAVDVAPAPESQLSVFPSVLSVAAVAGSPSAPADDRQAGRDGERLQPKIPRFIELCVLLI